MAWNFLRASLTANDVIKIFDGPPFLFRASKVYKPEILQRHQRATLCGPSLYNTRRHFQSREMYTNASSVLNNNSSGRYKSISRVVICLLSLNGIRLSLDQHSSKHGLNISDHFRTAIPSQFTEVFYICIMCVFSTYTITGLCQHK